MEFHVRSRHRLSAICYSQHGPIGQAMGVAPQKNPRKKRGLFHALSAATIVYSILLRISLIGALEFFKCKQSDVTLEESLNLVQVNSCDRIRFFHGPECLRPVLYVINLSVDVSCAHQGGNEIILVNTFDNLLNQRVVTVQTNTTNTPPLLAGGTLPIYIQEIGQMLFCD